MRVDIVYFFDRESCLAAHQNPSEGVEIGGALSEERCTTRKITEFSKRLCLGTLGASLPTAAILGSQAAFLMCHSTQHLINQALLSSLLGAISATVSKNDTEAFKRGLQLGYLSALFSLAKGAGLDRTISNWTASAGVQLSSIQEFASGTLSQMRALMSEKVHEPVCNYLTQSRAAPWLGC